MLRFPCLLFKENRVVHSKEELEDRLKEAALIGKSCEVGCYAFSAWENTKPIKESVIIDKIIFTGPEEKLTQLAEKKLKEGFESILIYDGESYLLFVLQPLDSLEDLLQIKEPDVEVITDVMKKFVFPGFRNLKSGQVSKVVKRWRVE